MTKTVPELIIMYSLMAPKLNVLLHTSHAVQYVMLSIAVIAISIDAL